MNDAAVVELSRQIGIDLAIDLKGYTQDARPRLFALQAAPVQVNFLGYPGTMAGDFMDYLIADATLIQTDEEDLYREKIIRLPFSYQPNDSRRAIAPRKFERHELGLPQHGFVYACFNHNYKITPEVFDSWARILRHTPGSVLWLLKSNPVAAAHLTQEISRRGVAPERLVFAANLPLPDHLARISQADLFLDTFPYNAHTTASDALWAGLPILTRTGRSFASRVCASLLGAVQLTELVTHTQEDYEQLAISLAGDDSRLAAIRERLAANKLTAALFDAQRFTRYLECAYYRMYDRSRQHLPPRSFDIPA